MKAHQENETVRNEVRMKSDGAQIDLSLQCAELLRITA
jgi:hypothetical protein